VRAKTGDGFELHYEIAGSGTAIVFVHEFAGDHRSWEGQLLHFAKTHRCVTFSARGFRPSDVPTAAKAYSQEHAADDIGRIMDAAGIEKAHIVGLSMGALAALHFGLRHPRRALSLCLGGCGYGSDMAQLAAFRERSAVTAKAVEALGMPGFAALYATGLGRVQFQNKDPRGYGDFLEALGEHDPVGAAMTQRYLQGGRPSLYQFEKQLTDLDVPTLILTGDEDYPCIEPGLFLKRTMPAAALALLPNCGHSLNLEEPDDYNRLLGRFLHQVEAGRWPRRDPRGTELPAFPV
jgi:pimeloyl-ACP methyl ester carboxylesterase